MLAPSAASGRARSTTGIGKVVRPGGKSRHTSGMLANCDAQAQSIKCKFRGVGRIFFLRNLRAAEIRRSWLPPFRGLCLNRMKRVWLAKAGTATPHAHDTHPICRAVARPRHSQTCCTSRAICAAGPLNTSGTSPASKSPQPSIPRPSRPKTSTRDHLESVADSLEQLESTGDFEIEDCGPKKFRFDLCPQCWQRYSKDPLGRDSLRRLNFSQN